MLKSPSIFKVPNAQSSYLANDSMNACESYSTKCYGTNFSCFDDYSCHFYGGNTCIDAHLAAWEILGGSAVVAGTVIVFT